MTQQILEGKVGLVFGVANKRSIAWAIAKAWATAGARLIFNYQGERLKENVEELVSEFGEKTPLFPCDVSSDDEIKAFFENVRGDTDRVDLMLHSLAFAPREALEGDFVSTRREAFRVAHDVSAYSLVALAREAAPMMTNGGSIVAMTYYGSEKVVPHYNVMGVAKASLEASALSCLRPRPEKNPGKLHFCRTGPDARRAWHQRVHVNVETLSGTLAFETQLRSGRVRRHRSFSRQRRRRGHYRPGHLRRWRLSNNGNVISSFSFSYACSQ
jgi:NADP-dependent 3-hydroxy acid dehydrogenase YdfG